MLRLQQCDIPFKSIMATLQGLIFSCLVWSPAATAVNDTAICFSNPDNYANPSIHLWDAIPTGQIPDTNWPGHAMSTDGNFYCYDPGVTVTSVNVIFSDNGSSQTPDLNVTGANSCYKDNQWETLSACGLVVSGDDYNFPTGKAVFFHNANHLARHNNE